MFTPSRRAFLGTSLAALAAGSASAVDPVVLPAKLPDDPSFRPDTLFLTWQHDPTTTMTVQWVGVRGETADTSVHYRVATAPVGPLAAVGGGLLSAGTQQWTVRPTTTHPYPLSDYKVFRVELTGLRPGTDYQFKIGKESPTYRFRTMPAKATDVIHFVSGGDCGVNPYTVLNNAQAARQDPMFALIGGDLAYENGKTVATHLSFLRNYSRHMVGRDGRLIPMVACLGNHEVVGGYGTDRAKAPFFYALFGGLYQDTGYATLDFGDYLSLVLLDSGHTSAIGGDQADWLDKTLKARKDHPHVFAVNHVPAYPSARKAEGAEGKLGTGELNRRHWVPLFEKHRVPVVLEHHDHTFKRTRPLLDGLASEGGVVYLGDGSWGRLRAPQPPEKLALMAAVNQDYHLSLHRLEATERFHLALGMDGRVMDVTRTGQRTTGMVRVGGCESEAFAGVPASVGGREDRLKPGLQQEALLSTGHSAL